MGIERLASVNGKIMENGKNGKESMGALYYYSYDRCMSHSFLRHFQLGVGTIGRGRARHALDLENGMGGLGCDCAWRTELGVHGGLGLK